MEPLDTIDTTLDTGERALLSAPSAIGYYLETLDKTNLDDFVGRLAEYAERHGDYQEILNAFALWAASERMSQMDLYQWLQDRGCPLNPIDPRELLSHYRPIPDCLHHYMKNAANESEVNSDDREKLFSTREE